MTYDDILNALGRGKCTDTHRALRALQRAVDDEAHALGSPRVPGASYAGLRDGGKAAYKAATEFYADDITQQLKDPQEPTPSRAKKDLSAALEVYEKTGDHNHDGRPISPGGPCGSGKDCWVRRIREALDLLNGEG